MRVSAAVRLFLPLAAVAQVAHALSLPFRRDFQVQARSQPVSASFVNAGNPYNFRVVDLDGDENIIYVANITVDGRSYEVQLDTGSADLFINTQGVSFTPNVVDTGYSMTLVYGDSTVAQGPIYVAPVQFGNFSVPHQAFISAPGTNATADNDRGLLGLGPWLLSDIDNVLYDTEYRDNALPLLNQIFGFYDNTTNYITFQLSRSNLGITDGGVFTIGETDPAFSAIVDQPKVTIDMDSTRWISYMDAMVVNGKTFSGNGMLSTSGDAAIRDKLLATFDTGTSMGVLPVDYFDAIYQDIQGIQTIDEEAGLYWVPCETKLNVSMVFNGIEYPINPLDMTRLQLLSNGQSICVNSFTPQNVTESSGTDLILGDAFLRNVYALFNYGNWTTPGNDAPYVQLLSTTNQTEAFASFNELNTLRVEQWLSLNGTFSP